MLTDVRRDELTVNVKDCARCSGEHTITFLVFTRPAGEYTHFAMCPETGEPILLKIETDASDPAEVDEKKAAEKTSLPISELMKQLEKTPPSPLPPSYGIPDLKPTTCRHPSHYPPSHMVIPGGQRFTHRCPACGARFELFGTGPTLNTPFSVTSRVRF